MERRNRIEDFNPYQDLIVEYPFLEGQSAFVLAVAQEMVNFYQEQLKDQDRYRSFEKSATAKKLEEKLLKFVSIAEKLSQIHEDECVDDSPFLIEKFQKIIKGLTDDEELRGKNQRKIKRINKIFALIEIFDRYNKIFSKGVSKENQELYLETQNRRYVSLFYSKLVEGYIPEDLDLHSRKFIGYGSHNKQEVENILENVLGFILKPGKGGKSEFGKDGFTLEVDIQATNESLENQA